MRADRPAVVSGIVAAAAVLLLASAATASAAFSPGARSIGDPIYPQIGNGGYDVLHYEVDLRYDPATNRFRRGTRATITARATQGLSRLSLDFQRDLAIDSVAVDGAPAARVARADARPRLSRDPAVTQPAKLIVTPSTGIDRGATFTVSVAYHGRPVPIVDPDHSSEGWLRACSSRRDCDGSFTVNEPIGAQSWFPCNDHPADKATFELRTTAPSTHVAIGAGEQVSRVGNGDGTSTTTWVEDAPMAPYLATGTVGRFDVETGSMIDRAGAAPIGTFIAIDSAAAPRRKAAVRETAARIPALVDFLSRRLGPYPFATAGVVADWVPKVGYVLENQTKPHFPGTRKGPFVGSSTLAHELAHQWMGDSISPARWNAIWFNEGWATLMEVTFDHAEGGRQTPREYFRAVHRSSRKRWRIAPARLDGDPRQLFNSFVVYNRPGAMLQGLRMILGDERFHAFARELGDRYGGGNIDRRGFVAAAQRASGFRGRRLRRLGDYAHQWLLWERRPNLTPADF